MISSDVQAATLKIHLLTTKTAVEQRAQAIVGK